MQPHCCFCVAFLMNLLTYLTAGKVCFNFALVDLGVLSTKSKGNYWVTDGIGTDLDPELHLGYTFFVNKEEAEKYMKQVWGNAKYPVKIIKC